MFTFHKPSTNNTIVCFTDRPTDEPMMFAAEFVRASIREKWELDE